MRIIISTQKLQVTKNKKFLLFHFIIYLILKNDVVYFYYYLDTVLLSKFELTLTITETVSET
jgi:hypothetical protein